ncbi:TRAP transporter large permease [Brevibacterium renqingii]|uniref:TRAP transporter large permease n=1 Tax=Brevibacterium renqingii TaxID=2776916 RepID=UPI001ADF338E|nr:TRAP transporter large permease [Brevibacterium renqingii]
MLVLTITVLLLILILLRVPIAFAILISGISGLLILGGPADVIGVLMTIPQSAVGNNSLAAIPLFILMAQFVLHSGALASLFDSAKVLVGRMRGGTAHAAVGAGAIFAAVSGSSTAAAATLAHTSTGELIRQGYDKKLSAGVVAAAGTLAAMIPPSVLLIFYAITAEAGVGPTLIAGIIPGLLVALALVITITVLITFNSSSAPRGEASSGREKLLSLAGLLPVAGLFVLVVGLVFLGVTTATEAAAVGCLGALALMLGRKKLTWHTVTKSFGEALSSSIMILTIIMAAHVFGHFITESQVTPRLVGTLSTLPVAPIIIVAIIAFGYLILGFFMDQMAIIALTVPVTLPVVTELGFDPIWFGIVVILLAEIGLITPPLGLNVFVVAQAARMPVESVFRGSIPFVVAILVVGVLLFAFPQIVLILPELMGSV